MTFLHKKRTKEKWVVSVLGVDDAESATELAVELGIMASNAKFQNIVVAECGREYRYSAIRNNYHGEILNARGDFKLDRIRFIPAADDTEIKKWVACEDVFLVLDCGAEGETFFTNQHICTRSFLLCRLMPWRMEHIRLLLRENGARGISKILVTKGKRRIKDLRKKDQRKTKEWQEAEDPFGITPKRLKELYQLTFE